MTENTAISVLAYNMRTTLNGLKEETRKVVEGEHDAIMAMQRQQLIDGLTSEGKPITPSYSQDPYLKNPQGYIAWKSRLPIPQSTRRNDDTPNLYINGRFHSELDVTFKEDGFAVVPSTPYAAKIVSKYGLDTFGLDGENKDMLIRERILPNLLTNIRQRITER